ncbi:hypothetical protein PCL_08660 [Purpureocillium lilacinum]|uniref:Uncharacterized protein n=1 Tax=Purpureocillium lilacinum TaxID=33203 RepID=A0A2U3DR14_PURLI|nr:hypothetical protein Purlil1_11917 [Purpureocillium lilacinum]PWI64691.1 hypothetical protein PCL_08660 [Purpureocillium lilacinum]
MAMDGGGAAGIWSQRATPICVRSRRAVLPSVFAGLGEALSPDGGCSSKLCDTDGDGLAGDDDSGSSVRRSGDRRDENRGRLREHPLLREAEVDEGSRRVVRVPMAIV